MRDVKERPHAICDWEPSMTKQSFKDECDINKIIARYGVHNASMIRPQRQGPAQFLQVPVPDFQQALEMIEQAESAFASLPAKTRQIFENDPLKFVSFLDTATPQKLAEIGLVESASQTPVSEKIAE